MNQNPIQYKDHVLILLIIPFINALNYYLTYSNIRWGSFFFITFTLDTLEGYIAWYAARWAIIKFDRSYPWETHFSKRLFLQLPVVVIIIIAVLTFLTEFVNFVATDKPLPLRFYTQAVFIFMIWAIFINFLYMGLYFFRRHQQTKTEVSQKAEAKLLLVKTGRTQRQIPLDEISLFVVSNELVYGFTSEGKTPLPGYTLDRIEKMLDLSVFFRVNRQCIITRPLVNQVRKEENGKLALSVKAIENPIMISRLRAPAFKKWMEG
jgi:DNA-binding LytR/AlgR family response regulator